MKFQLSLRQQIALLMAVAMVPLLGLSVLNADLNAKAALSRTSQNLLLAVSLAAAHQQRNTDAVRQMLTTVAQVPEVRAGEATPCNRYLAALRQQLPGYSNLAVVGPDGFVRCHGLPSNAPVYMGDRPYIHEAMARRSFVTGEYTMGFFTGKPVVAFALPVLEPQGQVAFVVYATLELTEMTRSLTSIGLPAGATLGIHDRQGALLAGSAGLPLGVGEKSASATLLQALKNWVPAAAEGPDSQGVQRLWAFAPSSAQAHAGFLVVLSMDRSLVLLPIRHQLGLELAALLLTALLGAWLAWRLGGRAIVRPTNDILNATRQFQRGRLQTRVALDADDEKGEFSQIAAGLNRMAESMQAHQAALQAELANSQAAQEKLQDAQRLARIGHWQMDLAIEKLTLSEETHAFFGFSPPGFDGAFSSFLSRIHRDDRAALEAACDAAIQTGAGLDIEFRVMLPDGGVRWIHQFSRVRAQGAAPPTQRSGVMQDITERKNAELAMVRSTELLNRTGTLARIGGWELDVQTMALYWSEEIYRIHELAPLAPISLDAAVRFYAPEAQPVIEAALHAALHHGTAYDMELPLLTASKRQVWVRTQGRALVEKGRVVRLVGVLQDVSAQHRAHEHLRLLEACLSRLNDAVVITEAEPAGGEGPRIVFVNDAFERQSGFAREEVLGQSPCLLRADSTRRSELEPIATALQNGQPVLAQLINYNKDSQEFWGELDIVPVFDAKGVVTHWVSVERDITQRKLAEQDLIDSEQRYATLFETAPLPMWVYDTATSRFLAVNQAAVAAYGYSAAEFLSMTIFDIRPAAEHDHLRHWLSNPSRKQAQWHDVRKDGSIFSVETVSQPIQYAGRAARLVVAVDKTSQDDAEKKTQEYLFTLQRAADAAQAITWHQTLDGTMQEIAEQARGVIGVHQAVVSLRAESGAEGKVHALSLSEKYESYRDWIRPPDNCSIYNVVCENNRLLRMTQAELQANLHWHAPGVQADKYFPMHGLLAVPLIARNGKNIGLLQLSDKYEGEFTKQDEYVALELSHLASAALENSRLLEKISLLNAGLEQKVAERTLALARQEALFRVLAEQAPQLVWTADPQGRATYFNRAWFSLVGGELKDWTGYQWLAVVHPEDVPGMKANWQASQASHVPYAGIRRLKSRAGALHTMSYRASPVLDAEGNVAFWVGIDADISEVKAIEAALRLSNQELEAFSYSVSHDLRAPLNTVDGFSRLLAKELALQLADGASAKTSHYLARIQAGAAQMGRLIEDLLSLSQVTRAPLHAEPIDLSLMASHILDDWRMRQPERVVTVEIEDGLRTQGDERLVKVMMENLLANAWKFTSKLAHASIAVGQASDASGLPVFFVKDNGAGFDMAFSAKLFDPFQRLHAVSEFAGTGIGLATVSRVIKRHGGRIWAESAPGRGATFFFTLPQSKPYHPD